MFPNEDPLGKRVLKSGEVWFTVTGVVADVKNSGLAHDTAPEYYVLRKPAPDLTFANAEPPAGWRSAIVVARTGLSAVAIAALLKDAVQSIDSTVPVETGTMRGRLREATAGSRFQSILLSAFGVVGILLAAVGSFGVTAFWISQRRRAMGIRLALGATPGNVQWLSIRRVAWWTALGHCRLLRRCAVASGAAVWRPADGPGHAGRGLAAARRGDLCGGLDPRSPCRAGEPRRGSYGRVIAVM